LIESSFIFLAFTSSNETLQIASFTTWSSFILYLHQSTDLDQQVNNTRLLKLLLIPLLADTTSNSKLASIEKCHAWLTLISFNPTNVSDVILPFLSFAFGHHQLSTTTTAWWLECRHLGGKYLHDLLAEVQHGESIIRMAGDQILNFIFDWIIDQLLETTTQSSAVDEKPHWLSIWNAFLKHLMTIFQSNVTIDEKQRIAINTCLLTRIEQCWIDSRIVTRLLLNLFETFEQINFPLAIESVLRDTSVRTKTLSATQNYTSTGQNASRKLIAHCH
jgi:hypothetical protein